MKEIEVIENLGEGANGTVDLIRFRGEELVMKTLKNKQDVNKLIHEAMMHNILKGAGGAPLLHSVRMKPPCMLMSCAGTCYISYVKKCTDLKAIESLIIIAEKLHEIHERNVIHNDFKGNNVTVTVAADGKVDFHVIDFGMSTNSGEVLYTHADPCDQYWMAPEVLAWKPTRPASDVYSFGQLMNKVEEHVI